MIRTVIFDFGNVIIQWRPFRALSHLFEDEAEMGETLKSIGFFEWNAEQDRGRSWEDGLAAVPEEHAHIYKAYKDGLIAAHSALVPGTSELIERLHKREVGLAGLTNAATVSYQAIREAAPAVALLNDVVVSAEAGVIKPDPAIFKLCLERNGLTPAEAFFVDDSLANCESAEALGIAAHHFKDATGLEADLTARGLL